MRFTSYVAAATALVSAARAAPSPQVAPRDDLATSESEVASMISGIYNQKVEELDAEADAEDGAEFRSPGKGNGNNRKCTARNIVFRREYGALSKAERLDYVKAVKCLMKLPPRTPKDVAPGAMSRYDDFNVVHIQKTLTHHYTGNFLAWHRWYVFQYEKALRDECGYKGYQPYWDWAKYAAAPEKSPIFNGDDYSLGGNGEYIPHDGPVVAPPPGSSAEPLQLPAGLGGGIVTKGPFAGMNITLGPIILAGAEPGPQGGLGYNPRPFKRDVGPGMTMRYSNYTTILNLLLKPNIDEWRFLLEGVAHSAEIGPHGGGHYTIGGDPGGDFFIAPGDPAFWVHHGQVDRMWALWQLLDPKTRYTDLGSGMYAHQSWWNEPPTPLTQLDEILDLGYASDAKTTIREMMDTTKGPLCYFYL